MHSRMFVELVAFTAALAMLVIPSTSRAVQEFSAAPSKGGGVPRYVSSMGGPGHAEIYPSGVDIAPDGSVVVADTGNNAIVSYSPDGSLQWKKGTRGSGIDQFSNPRDVAVDQAGNIYVADASNQRIVALDPWGGWITSWRGPPDDLMGTPMGVGVAGELVYVADAGKQKVRVFGPDGAPVGVIGSQGDCAFSPIRDVDADPSGNIYVANYTAKNILKFSPDGTCLMVWGSPGTGPGQFKNPYGVDVAVDPALGTPRVFVADSNNNRIQIFDPAGVHLATVGEPGLPGAPNAFTGLRRVAVGADGTVWGADMWGYSIDRFLPGADGYSFGPSIAAVPPPLQDLKVFNEVRSIAFSPDGTFSVVDSVNQRIVRMDAIGHVLGACGERGFNGGDFNWPTGLAVDPATGQLWVADTKQSRLQVMNPDCTEARFVGSIGTGPTNFNWPYELAIRGTDGVAWVADTLNHRIKAYDVATRSVIGVYGSLGSGVGQFRKPSGIAIDPKTGRVLVADTGNNRIVELADTRGQNISVVRTVSSSFRAPQGVAIHPSGRMLVADTGNSQVVVLNAKGGRMGTLSVPNGFDQPTDVTIDPIGRVLVSDTFHDVIHVFE